MKKSRRIIPAALPFFHPMPQASKPEEMTRSAAEGLFRFRRSSDGPQVATTSPRSGRSLGPFYGPGPPITHLSQPWPPGPALGVLSGPI